MPNTLTNLVSLQEKAYGAEREAFCRIDTEAGKLVPTTWGDFRRDVDHMACALEILGIEPADIVAIIANNCPEFLITDSLATATEPCRCRFTPPQAPNRLNTL